MTFEISAGMGSAVAGRHRAAAEEIKTVAAEPPGKVDAGIASDEVAKILDDVLEAAGAVQLSHQGLANIVQSAVDGAYRTEYAVRSDFWNLEDDVDGPAAP